MKIIFESEFEKTQLTTGYCPGDIGLKELRLTDKRCCGSSGTEVCKECWEKAVEMKVKDYRKDAESIICSGRVIESEFFDILVEELAKKLEEDDKKCP